MSDDTDNLLLIGLGVLAIAVLAWYVMIKRSIISGVNTITDTASDAVDTAGSTVNEAVDDTQDAVDDTVEGAEPSDFVTPFGLAGVINNLRNNNGSDGGSGTVDVPMPDPPEEPDGEVGDSTRDRVNDFIGLPTGDGSGAEETQTRGVSNTDPPVTDPDDLDQPVEDYVRERQIEEDALNPTDTEGSGFEVLTREDFISEVQSKEEPAVEADVDNLNIGNRDSRFTIEQGRQGLFRIVNNAGQTFNTEKNRFTQGDSNELVSTGGAVISELFNWIENRPSGDEVEDTESEAETRNAISRELERRETLQQISNGEDTDEEEDDSVPTYPNADPVGRTGEFESLPVPDVSGSGGEIEFERRQYFQPDSDPYTNPIGTGLQFDVDLDRGAIQQFNEQGGVVGGQITGGGEIEDASDNRVQQILRQIGAVPENVGLDVGGTPKDRRDFLRGDLSPSQVRSRLLDDELEDIPIQRVFRDSELEELNEQALEQGTSEVVEELNN